MDGFLFFRQVNPPHGAPLTGGALEATPAASQPTVGAAYTALNPARRSASGSVNAASLGTNGRRVRGVVLDQKTQAPVPYASVAIPGQPLGTVADAQGQFELRLPPEASTLQISSVGYATATLTSPATSLLTVRLTPAAYELQGVQVQGQSLDPRRIMKKVLAAIPLNYEQQDYAAQVYAHRRHTNFDTLRTDIEYVSQVFVPAGQRHLHGGFLMREPTEQHRVQEMQVLGGSNKPLAMSDIGSYGQGFYTGGADPVRTSPLFKPGTWRKFRLELDSVLERGGETVYVIRFQARRANRRSTGSYLQAGYSGRFEVQQSNYAVTRYVALWQGDTATENAVARKYAGRGNLISRLYNCVYTAQRNDHAVDYARAANGRYYVHRSVGQGLSAGRVLQGRQPFYAQGSCVYYFTPLPPGTPALPLNPGVDPRFGDGETLQLPHTAQRTAFWQAFQRPVTTWEAVQPEAVKH